MKICNDETPYGSSQGWNKTFQHDKMDRLYCKTGNALIQIQTNLLCSDAINANRGITGLKRLHIFAKTADSVSSIIKKKKADLVQNQINTF